MSGVNFNHRFKNLFFPFALSLCLFANADDVPNVSPGSPSPASLQTPKKIVVFAPHPDDEVITSAGVIYKALKDKVETRVVVMTNGDFYGKAEGLRREGESVVALGLLGLPEKQITFFGYGDSTLFWVYHAMKADEVITSRAGGTETYGTRGNSHLAYHNSRFGVPAPYTRNSIREDLATYISEYAPTDIYTTSIYDSHPDHSALGQFVIDAILEVQKTKPDYFPNFHQTLVHIPGDNDWPKPPFTPNLDFQKPAFIDQTPLKWSDIESIPVPSPMRDPNIFSNLKAQAILSYHSQVRSVWLRNFVSPPWLMAFVKANEFFWVSQPGKR